MYRTLKQESIRLRIDLKNCFKEPPLLILLLLISFASISAVLFTPALPMIGQQFGVSVAQTQLTMTLFLMGYAVGSLFYAPFANRFGRKKALYFGIVLAICSCIMILSSASTGFTYFVIGRLFQGIGSSVGMKIVYTMVGDLYEQDVARKKFAAFGLSFSVGPSLAVFLGGFLTKNFGWESCYYFLMAYSCLLLFASYLLPETMKERDHKALHWKNVIGNYGKQLKNKVVVTSALTMSATTSIVYMFASGAPFIGIEKIGLSPQTFGSWGLLPTLGLFTGAAISGWLVGKRSIFEIMKYGIITMLVFSALMLFLFSCGFVTAATLFLPAPLIYTGLSMIFPNASALGMTHAKDKANASAIINFTNMGGACIAVICLQLLPQKYVILMPLLFLGLGGVLIVLRERLKNLTV